MQPKTAVCTIIAKNYLPFARCLMASLRRQHPDFLQVVFLVDRPAGYFDPAGEEFEIVLSEDLDIPDSRWFHFKYTVLELSTAIKPYALEMLFQRHGVDRVLYFDPDICIYDSLMPLIERLDQGSIVLTPHLTATLTDSLLPGELEILRSGTYNLGFIALRGTPTTLSFLRWWQEKLYDHCRRDLARGLFVDQRWIDLAPGLFDGVLIERDPGHNVAYWNLSHRRIRSENGRYTVNGRPLRFFHFSGFDPETESDLSRHQNRYRLYDLEEAGSLAEEYRAKLLQLGYATCKNWPYEYASFRGGEPILNLIRHVGELRPEILTRIRDPFSKEGFKAISQIYNERVSDRDGRLTALTLFALQIYESRADVRAAMPDVFGQDQARFLEWMLSSARRELSVGEELLRPLRSGLAALRTAGERKKKSSRLAHLSVRLPSDLPAVCQQILAQDAAALIALGRKGMTSEACEAHLNEKVNQRGARVFLTRLAVSLHRMRPDVQRAFPDPFRADAAKFLRWFLSYAPAEYRLGERFLRPMRAAWDELAAELSPSERLRLSTELSGMSASARLRQALSANGSRGSIKHRVAKTDSAPFLQGEPRINRFGVNLVGYVSAASGVGQSVRSAVLAARSEGIPFQLHKVDVSGRRERDCPNITSPLFDFNVLHINADQTPVVGTELGTSFFKGKYSVGYWAWELEDFPDCWLGSFQWVREVWVPSSFCQDAIARRSPVPVVRMPHCVQLDVPPAMARIHFGLPEDKFLFLTMFDMLSVFERKNPLAVIEAFRLASRYHHQWHLVVKVNNGDWNPVANKTLRTVSAGLPVTILDQVLSRDETNALLQTCDCLISLHRSEGFGLTVAESMYLGKPVIATAYSGNMDFTHPDKAFLVRYRPRNVGPGADPYPASAVWADPSVAHATEQMRTVYECPEHRIRVAKAGQDYVRDCLSPQAVGKLMRQRLDYLSENRQARPAAAGR